MKALRVFVALTESRKAMIGLGTAAAIIFSIIGFQRFPPEVVISLVIALGTVASVLINAIAKEDAAAKTAAGVVAAANATAIVQATTTTVSTPGGSDVQVIANDSPDGRN